MISRLLQNEILDLVADFLIFVKDREFKEYDK